MPNTDSVFSARSTIFNRFVDRAHSFLHIHNTYALVLSNYISNFMPMLRAISNVVCEIWYCIAVTRWFNKFFCLTKYYRLYAIGFHIFFDYNLLCDACFNLILNEREFITNWTLLDIETMIFIFFCMNRFWCRNSLASRK